MGMLKAERVVNYHAYELVLLWTMRIYTIFDVPHQDREAKDSLLWQIAPQASPVDIVKIIVFM